MNSNRDVPTIESVLAQFVVDPEPYVLFPESPLDMRALAARLKLLPVMLDMGGCYGLMPDGKVASFCWDDPQQVRIEHDERIRNMVLFQASIRYPLLVCLNPKRPASASTCTHCGGTGMVPGLPLHLGRRIVCYCGGLGWLPTAPNIVLEVKG
jgi:hypothetical protein